MTATHQILNNQAYNRMLSSSNAVKRSGSPTGLSEKSQKIPLQNHTTIPGFSIPRIQRQGRRSFCARGAYTGFWNPIWNLSCPTNPSLRSCPRATFARRSAFRNAPSRTWYVTEPFRRRCASASACIGAKWPSAAGGGACSPVRRHGRAERSAATLDPPALHALHCSLRR